MVNAPLCIVFFAEKMLFLNIVYFGNGLIVYAKHIKAMETVFLSTHTIYQCINIYINKTHLIGPCIMYMIVRSENTLQLARTVRWSVVAGNAVLFVFFQSNHTFYSHTIRHNNHPKMINIFY